MSDDDNPQPKPVASYKSFFEMTNGEILVAGSPRVNFGLVVGYEVRLSAKRLPDTHNCKDVYKYTARIYRGSRRVGLAEDTNFYHMIGVMLAGELERLVDKDRRAQDAGQEQEILDGRCDFCPNTKMILTNYLGTNTAMCPECRQQLLAEYAQAVRSNVIAPPNHIDGFIAWCALHVDTNWKRLEPEGA